MLSAVELIVATRVSNESILTTPMSFFFSPLSTMLRSKRGFAMLISALSTTRIAIRMTCGKYGLKLLEMRRIVALSTFFGGGPPHPPAAAPPRPPRIPIRKMLREVDRNQHPDGRIQLKFCVARSDPVNLPVRIEKVKRLQSENRLPHDTTHRSKAP
jgi:hypothetical protein